MYLWNDFWPLLSNRAWTGTPFDPQFHIISLRSVWSFAFLTFVPDFLASNVTWEWSGDAPSCHHPLMQIPVGRKFIIEIISLELCWIKQAKRCLIRELKLRLGDTVVANPKTWHIYQKKNSLCCKCHLPCLSLQSVIFFAWNCLIQWFIEKKINIFFENYAFQSVNIERGKVDRLCHYYYKHQGYLIWFLSWATVLKFWAISTANGPRQKPAKTTLGQWALIYTRIPVV